VKDIILETLFGKIRLSLSEPDPVDGRRSGSADWSELREPHTADVGADPDYAMDAIEALVLAHACAGVDVESAAYLEGLNSALEAIDNNS
jgi:hypothetical protein